MNSGHYWLIKEADKSVGFAIVPLEQAESNFDALVVFAMRDPNTVELLLGDMYGRKPVQIASKLILAGYEAKYTHVCDGPVKCCQPDCLVCGAS